VQIFNNVNCLQHLQPGEAQTGVGLSGLKHGDSSLHGR
jgi:hypothetical protein